MKTLLTISILFISLTCFAQVGVDSLYKSQTIGQNARNQRVGNGLQVDDTLMVNGYAKFNGGTNISGGGDYSPWDTIISGGDTNIVQKSIGNVGIGTSTPHPTYKTHIISGSSGYALLVQGAIGIDDTTCNISVENGTAALFATDTTTGAIKLNYVHATKDSVFLLHARATVTNLLYVNGAGIIMLPPPLSGTTGNVGIGTASPNETLDVDGNTRTSGQFITSSAINSTAGDGAVMNVQAGRFRKDISGSTFTLTNDYITSSSQIIPVIITTGLTTGGKVVCVPGSGSAVCTFEDGAGGAEAPSANTDVSFIIW